MDFLAFGSSALSAKGVSNRVLTGPSRCFLSLWIVLTI